MNRDAWADAYRLGMVTGRLEAQEVLEKRQRRLDVALADVRATPDQIFTRWIQFRTASAIHQTVFDLADDPSDFFHTLESSASARAGNGN